MSLNVCENKQKKSERLRKKALQKIQDPEKGRKLIIPLSLISCKIRMAGPFHNLIRAGQKNSKNQSLQLVGEVAVALHFDKVLKGWFVHRMESQNNVDLDFENTGATLAWQTWLSCVTEQHLRCFMSQPLFWAHLLLWHCSHAICVGQESHGSKRDLCYIMENPLQPVNTTIKKLINIEKQYHKHSKFWNYYWEGQNNTNLQRII